MADARDLQLLLQDPSIGDYEAGIVEDGSLREVQVALESFFLTIERNDQVLLHLSGHGAADHHDGGLHFLVRDSDPNLLSATCLSGRFVKRLLDRLPEECQVAILIDSCHSGAISADVIAKSVPILARPVDLAGAGRAIVMSSSAVQQSFEVMSADSGWTSAFTQAVVHGIRTGDADLDGDGLVTLDELFRFSKEMLSSSSAGQTPLLTEIDVDGRILIANSPSGPKQRPGMPEEVARACESAYPGLRAAGAAEVAKLLHSAVPTRSKEAKRLLRELTSDPDAEVAAIAKHALHPAPRRKKRKRADTSVASDGPRIQPVSTVTVSRGEFMEAVSRATQFVNSDGTRRSLSGVSIEMSDDENLTLASTDSYRLYVKRISASGDSFASVVPADLLRSMRFGRGPETLRLLADGERIEIEGGDSVFADRCIDYEFPDYRALLTPLQGLDPLILPSQLLADQLDRHLGLSRESEPVVLEYRDREFTLRAASSDPGVELLGPIAETSGARQGEQFAFAFNPHYLREVLAVVGPDDVEVRSNKTTGPVLFTRRGFDECCALMPVRIP